MSTQVVHSTPITLGPFLRLILTLHCEPDTARGPQQPAGRAPNLSAAAANEQTPLAGTGCHLSTRALTLGPFLTLLLTLREGSSWSERDCWPGAKAPRGAVLAARYVSR